ncbi:MAG: hypothetical protein NC131_11245, partial [Roseburia sp.]|nr:hypothetical protein [Roseburia sp.]
SASASATDTVTDLSTILTAGIAAAEADAASIYAAQLSAVQSAVTTAQAGLKADTGAVDLTIAAIEKFQSETPGVNFNLELMEQAAKAADLYSGTIGTSYSDLDSALAALKAIQSDAQASRTVAVAALAQALAAKLAFPGSDATASSSHDALAVALDNVQLAIEAAYANVRSYSSILEYKGENDDHNIPLSEESSNTNFYLVVAPADPTKYSASVITLRVMKLEPNVVAATSVSEKQGTDANAKIKGAAVRQVQIGVEKTVGEIQTGNSADLGETVVYDLSDFLFYENKDARYDDVPELYPRGSEQNIYYAMKADNSGYAYPDVMALAGDSDNDGVPNDLPTFVVKVRYPDIGNTATVKLTTENIYTTLRLYKADGKTFATAAKKANDVDKTVTFTDIALNPESTGYTALKVQANLEVDGAVAMPKDYLIILEYANKGTDLVSVADYADNTYSGDANGYGLAGMGLELGYNDERYDVQTIYVKDKDGNNTSVVDYYYVSVPRIGAGGSVGPLFIEAAAGVLDPITKKPVYNLKSKVTLMVPDVDGNRTLPFRDNASDERIYLARREVPLYDKQVDTELGQIIEIIVEDEAGLTKTYQLRVKYRSPDDTVIVRSPEVAGKEVVEPKPMTDTSFGGSIKRDLYTVLVDRDRTAMPFRITATNEHASILVPTVEKVLNGETVQVPYYFTAATSDIKGAMADHTPTQADWDANKVDGLVISDVIKILDLTDEDLAKALEIGIYVPFYTKPEDGTAPVLRLIMFRWSFTDLLAEALIADYKWHYVGDDGTEDDDLFHQYAVRDEKFDGKNQVYNLTIPSDLATLDLTLIPELPVTSYILFDEDDTEITVDGGSMVKLVDDPTLLDYIVRNDYRMDGELGIYNQRVNIPLTKGEGENKTDKDQIHIYMFVPAYDENGAEILTRIPVTLNLTRISTDKTLEKVVTNAETDHKHEAVKDRPATDQYLTYIPNSNAYTLADFTVTLGHEDEKLKVPGSIEDYQGADERVVNFQRGFTKSDETIYLPISGDTKGFFVDMTALSAFGQYRVAQIIAENDAKAADDPTKMDETALQAYLVKEYNKHTKTYTMVIVPTDMDLDISVLYARINENDEDLPRAEDDSYSVFDYKANPEADHFKVEASKQNGVKLQLIDNATGLPVYDSTSDDNKVFGLNRIDMLSANRSGNNPLSTKFIASGANKTKDDDKTEYTIRISSTQDGVETADGETVFLTKDYPFTIRPMSEDTTVRVFVTYTADDGTRYENVEASYENGVFTAPIGLNTTEVHIDVEGVNIYTKPLLDLINKEYGGTAGQTITADASNVLYQYHYPTLEPYENPVGSGTMVNVTTSSAPWTNFWAAANDNYTSSGNRFSVDLHSVTEGKGTANTYVALKVQAMAQDGRTVAGSSSDYGYHLRLERLSNLAELTVTNENKPVTDPYHNARDESTEDQNILVLYLDPYVAQTSTSPAKGDRDALARLTVSTGASIRVTDAAGGRVTGFPYTMELGEPAKEATLNVNTEANPYYIVTVMAQDNNPANTRVYHLYVRNKSTEINTGFVAAEGETGEYRIYHDLPEQGKGTVDEPFLGFIPVDASTLKIDPVDRNAIITRVQRYYNETFTSVAGPAWTSADLTPSNGLLYDVYKAMPGVYDHGAAVIDTPAGESGTMLYYAVTIASQAVDPDTGLSVAQQTVYVALERLDVNVDVEFVEAIVSTDNTVVGSRQNMVDDDLSDNITAQFNLNVAEVDMTVHIKAAGDENRVHVIGFAAEDENLANNYISGAAHEYQAPFTNTAADGTEANLFFKVGDVKFYREIIDDKGVKRVLTPNARKMYAAKIFRSNHVTDIGAIWVVDPAALDPAENLDETILETTWLNRMPAVQRPNNPTFYEISADPAKGDEAVVRAADGKFKVQVDGTNPYQTMIEIDPNSATGDFSYWDAVSMSYKIYNQNPDGVGRLRTTDKALYGNTTNLYTDMNFYVVSSSKVRQQWYTLRVYRDDTETRIDDDAIYIDNTQMVYTDVDATARTPMDPTTLSHHLPVDRRPVNLTVRPANGLAMVVLQDGDGNILDVQRGDSVFQGVEINKMGENRYTITVLSARDYMALREVEGDKLESKMAQLIADGTIQNWMDQAQFKTHYNLILDYSNETDAGIVGIAAKATAAGSYVDAQLIDLGDGRSAYMVRMPVSTTSAGYRVTPNNSKQTVEITTVAADGTVSAPTVYTPGQKVEGNVAVHAGITEMRVKVIPGNGNLADAKEYTVYFIRSTASILELKVNGVPVTSEGGVYQYTVATGTTQVRVEVTANSDLAKVSINKGEARFEQDWADVAIKLTAANNRKDIPIDIYSFTGGANPYATAGVSTTLRILRDTAEYRPEQVLFTTPGASAGVTASVDSYGRYEVRIDPTTNAATLDITTSDAAHKVSLYDYTTKNDLLYTVTANYQLVNGTPQVKSHTYRYNLSDLSAGRMYSITVYNNLNNGAYTAYPLAVISQNSNVELKAVAVDRGLASAQSLKPVAGQLFYTAEVDQKLKTATVSFETEDPNAVISLSSGVSSVGRLDAKLPLSGSGGTVQVTVTSSNGLANRTYTMTLTQAPVGGALSGVILDGKNVVSNNGDTYIATYTEPGQRDLVITATEGGTIEVRRLLKSGSVESEAVVSGTVTAGRWSGKVDLSDTRSDFNIYLGGEKKAVLSALRDNYPTGIATFKVAAGNVIPEGAIGGAAGATNGNWKDAVATTHYDPAGNAFVQYTVNIGANDKYVEIDVAAMDATTTVTLGYGDSKGILTPGSNISASNAAVFTTKNVSGQGHFVLDLSRLTWLTASNAVKDYNGVTMKEAYVDVIVRTAQGAEEVYTLHLVRVNDDDSLRLIRLTPEDGEVKLYDNEGSLAMDPDWLGKLEEIFQTDTIDGNDLYRILIKEDNREATLVFRATDDAARLTVSAPGVGEEARDPVDGDPAQVTIRDVVLEEEMTQFQIKVRAEDAAADDYKISYLQVFRMSDDATLKEAQLTFDFVDWTYPKDGDYAKPDGTEHKEQLTIKGQFVDKPNRPGQDDYDMTLGQYDGIYQFVVSAKADWYGRIPLDQLTISNATVTAIANKLGAKVEFTSPASAKTEKAWGRQSVSGQTISNTTTYNVKVTPSTGDNLKAKIYKFQFTVVDLELDTLRVKTDKADISLLDSYFVEEVDGVESVVYYQIIPSEVSYVEMEVQTHNNHTKWTDAEHGKASTLAVSELNSTVKDPDIMNGSRDFRQTVELTPKEESDRSQFQIKIGNYAEPGNKDTAHFVNTKYMRLYRTSSNTRLQTVIVYYEDLDTGEIIAVPAIYDDTIKQYSAFVPDYVQEADIEMIGPSDLSRLQLVPGMDAPVRKQYTVKDAPTPTDVTSFDLTVWAVDNTKGDYTVVIYKEDASLLKVTVDGTDAVKRAEPYTPAGKDTEHTLYDALAKADGDLLADVYAEATSRRALVNLGLAKDGVAMPTTETAGNYNYTFGPDGRPRATSIAVKDYVQPHANGTTSTSATEVEIKVKGNPGVTYNDKTYYLHIYQPDSNAQLDRFTMHYVDDLGKEGDPIVFLSNNRGDMSDYTVVLPSTAVSATLTAYSQHPMAPIDARIGAGAYQGQKKGIYDLALDPAQMSMDQPNETYFTVYSTDGTKSLNYTVQVLFADLDIRTLRVTDHYPETVSGIPGDTVVNNPSMSYQVIDNEKTRYYEALVGDAEKGEYNGDITIDYTVKGHGSAKITGQLDDGGYQPTFGAGSSLTFAGETMVANNDLQSMDIKVSNSVTVRVFDTSTSLPSYVPVTYEADYMLNVYRYSSNTDVLQVKFDYEDGGKDATQYGVYLREVNLGVETENQKAFVLYLPSDVSLGDLTVTTASKGAQVALSSRTFTEGATAGIRFTRNQVTLSELNVGRGDKFYAYVLSSNNRESKVYTIYIETLNLDLKEGSLDSTSSADPDGAHANHVVDDTFLSDLTRIDTTVDNTTCIITGTNHTHVDGKKITVYEAHMTNHATTTNAGVKTYDDVIEALVSLQTKGGANTNLDVSLQDSAYAATNTLTAPTAPVVDGSGQWKVDMVADTKAYVMLKITVTGGIYGADGAADSYGHTSNQLERVFYLKLLRVDTDVTVASGAEYHWFELTGTEYDRSFYNVIEQPSYMNYLPEDTEQFRVTMSANSDSAKLDVRVVPDAFDHSTMPAFDSDSVVYTRDHKQAADIKLDVPKLADGTYATEFWVVATVLNGAGDAQVRQSYFYKMERVVKSLEMAGATNTGDPSDYSDLSDVYEYFDMEGYIAGYQSGQVNATATAADETTGQRVIVAVEDPAKLAAGIVDATAVAKSLNDQVALGTLDQTFVKPSNLSNGDYETAADRVAALDLSSFKAIDENGDPVLYAKASIKGVEREDSNDEHAYNTEYVQFVKWDNDATLKSVELKYTVGGKEYSAYAYPVDAAKKQYVVYVPDVITDLTALVATTNSLYAQVALDANGIDADKAPDPIQRVGYKRHTVDYGAMTLVTDDVSGRSLDTDLNIQVLPSQNYYAGPATDYVLHIRPVNMGIVHVSFNEKPGEGEGTYDNQNTIPMATNPDDKPNTFEGKIEAEYDTHEALVIRLDEAIAMASVGVGTADRVKFGFIKQPEKPNVDRNNDVHGLWNIYDALWTEYASVSVNYNENYSYITWVDYTSEWFDSYDGSDGDETNYLAYLDGEFKGHVDPAHPEAAKGLVYTANGLTAETARTEYGWVAPADVSVSELVAGANLSAMESTDGDAYPFNMSGNR